MPEASSGAGQEGEVYGMLTMAGAAVALPLSALREVVPRPPSFSTLPTSAPGLLGAMGLRDIVVPVVDLTATLAPTGAAAPHLTGPGSTGVVVVVADGDDVLGLIAEQVHGVVRVPADALLELRAQGGALLVSHAFRHEGEVVTVLDPSRVVALPGMPTVRDRPAPAPAAARPDAPVAGARTTVALLRAGDHLLALDVCHVHTTVPAATPQASALSGGLCSGTTVHAGHDVAVVDPLRLLGLHGPDQDAPAGTDGRFGAGLVLTLGGGTVVLALDALVDLVGIDDADLMALASFSVPRPDLLAGLADLPVHGRCLVLDGGALRRDARLLALASTNTPAAGTGTGTTAGPPVPPSAAGTGVGPGQAPHLTYRAGIALATPLEQVSEILPVPAGDLLTTTRSVPAPSGGAAGAVMGVMAHRGRALPVVHLPTLLGHGGTSRPEDAERPGTDPRGGCLLLVDVDGVQVAFAVDSLHAIEPLAWTDPAPPAGAPAHATVLDPGALLRASPLVQVGAGDQLLRALDLLALARAVHTA